MHREPEIARWAPAPLGQMVLLKGDIAPGAHQEAIIVEPTAKKHTGEMTDPGTVALMGRCRYPLKRAAMRIFQVYYSAAQTMHCREDEAGAGRALEETEGLAASYAFKRAFQIGRRSQVLIKRNGALKGRSNITSGVPLCFEFKGHRSKNCNRLF